jgi:hypothetical protein
LFAAITTPHAYHKAQDSSCPSIPKRLNVPEHIFPKVQIGSK